MCRYSHIRRNSKGQMKLPKYYIKLDNLPHMYNMYNMPANLKYIMLCIVAQNSSVSLLTTLLILEY